MRYLGSQSEDPHQSGAGEPESRTKLESIRSPDRQPAVVPARIMEGCIRSLVVPRLWRPELVSPAKAGIQPARTGHGGCVPAWAGMTGKTACPPVQPTTMEPVPPSWNDPIGRQSGPAAQHLSLGRSPADVRRGIERGQHERADRRSVDGALQVGRCAFSVTAGGRSEREQFEHAAGRCPHAVFAPEDEHDDDFRGCGREPMPGRAASTALGDPPGGQGRFT